MSEYIHIGKVVATYALKGEVVIKHVLGKKTDFKDAEAVFIEEIKESYIPYFHENSTVRNDQETIVKLEGIDSKETAGKLLQKKLWLTKNDFEKLVSTTAPINLIGFYVLNNSKNIGSIKSVIEQPQQILLQIIIQNREVLIPLNTSTLKKIDRQKKEVHVALPDGLIEIYLKK